MPILLRLIFRFLSHLPLDWLHALGGSLGRLAYQCSNNYREHLHANLAQAMGSDVDPRVRAAAVAAAGQQVLELPKIWLRPLDEVAARVVQVSGWSLVEEAWAKGEGIIFLTPHLGCFEITAQYYASRCPAERPITVLYRAPKQAWLAPLIEGGRQRSRLQLAPADLSGVRRLIRALKQKEAVGMLPDQVPGVGEGRWLPFFGRSAYTMTLAARLTEVGASAAIMAWAERLPDGRGYHLHLSRPVTPLSGDTATRAIAINRELEILIRQCPGQYLWGYNRYKRPRGAEAAPDRSESGEQS